MPARFGVEHLLVHSEKRQKRIVHELIQYDSEGIDVRLIVVGSPGIDFRRHIGRCPGAAHRRAHIDMFHSSGNAEISQLETGLVAVENIAGLYVSVDDVHAFTGFQSFADINPQTDHALAAHRLRPLTDRFGQAVQFFHADHDQTGMVIPADMVVLNGDNIRVPFEADHRSDLGTDASDEFFNQGIRKSMQGQILCLRTALFE